MKKILLATTLLASTAGFAAAEVAVSGSARMGVTNQNHGAGSNGIVNSTNKAEFTSRFRVKFSATGETDGGLSFGASVRNDQNGVGNTSTNDSTVFISGAFGKIAMGDVSGAGDALVGQVSSVGLTGLGSLNEIGYLGNTKTAALYTYSAGALSLGVGIGQPTGADKAYSVAVKYSTDAYAVALSYEDTTAQKRTSVLGSATFSGVTVKAKFAQNDVLVGAQTKKSAYALSADYAMNGMNLTAFYSDGAGYRAAGDFDGVKAYGLGASYDLGGGASVVGGIAKANDGSKAVFDLGVSMSF